MVRSKHCTIFSNRKPALARSLWQGSLQIEPLYRLANPDTSSATCHIGAWLQAGTDTGDPPPWSIPRTLVAAQKKMFRLKLFGRRRQNRENGKNIILQIKNLKPSFATPLGGLFGNIFTWTNVSPKPPWTNESLPYNEYMQFTQRKSWPIHITILYSSISTEWIF